MLLQDCTTTFLQQAQQTPGMDFLVQAIQRGNLVLPAAGSGATSFAPNNAAFTDMLQTLSEPLRFALPHLRHPGCFCVMRLQGWNFQQRGSCP